ncbi:MAG: hypothetical protein EA349_04995 [Halomonadaceae bacterium]|nr:MAG: hypothetical protein EA349_04995 [Halomonadaceae bacterium]
MSKPGFLLLLALAVSGCAALESPGSPSPEPTPPTASEPREPRENCDWQSTRGIAQLLEWMNGSARFEFFPGEQLIVAPGRSGWQEGDEFKAELREAPQAGCDPQLIIIDPLE